jgi:hypothetical protein
MRTIIWCSLLSAALAAGGCKRKTDDTGSAAVEVKKTQEAVDKEAKDYQKLSSDQKATDKDRAKAESDLAAAKADLKAARDKYEITVKDRLAKIDIKLQQLQQRGDEKSKAALTKLQSERGELGVKLDAMKDRAADNWDAFTKDIDKSFDGMEKQLDDATKK